MNKPAPISGTSPRRTRAFEVFEKLQSDILHCRLRPGSRLRLSEIRRAYDSGLSPLREALMRLVAENLVVLEDRKGFRVAPVSKEEMIDLAHTRSELEAIAVRMAIERGDDHWEANLLARFHELSKRSPTLEDGSRDPEWELRHEAFHRAIHTGCGSPWITSLCGLLFDRSRRYRRLSVLFDGLGRNVAAEHEAILRAVMDRDAPKAVDLLRDHLNLTSRILIQGWEEIPNRS
ncbi:MAG: FCD domain-containing protein [Acidobacteriota bacterium]|nr:FCD domain-containing protein [Acidobacteriota bacterium]